MQSLAPWGRPPNSAVLLRLTHLFAVGEDAGLSRPANVSLQAIFTQRTIVAVHEMSLTANQRRDAMPPMPAMMSQQPEHGDASSSRRFRSMAPAVGADFVVTINPMEVRTYAITFA